MTSILDEVFNPVIERLEKLVDYDPIHNREHPAIPHLEEIMNLKRQLVETITKTFPRCTDSPMAHRMAASCYKCDVDEVVEKIIGE